MTKASGNSGLSGAQAVRETANFIYIARQQLQGFSRPAALTNGRCLHLLEQS